MNTISKIDSIKLTYCLKAFIKAVETKDLKTIRSLSLSKVHCEICIQNESFEYLIEDAFVNIDTLVAYLPESFQNANINTKINSERPHISSTSYAPADGNYPKEVKTIKGELFTEYEISYSIPSSENRYYITYTKVDDTFKLWKVYVAH